MNFACMCDTDSHVHFFPGMEKENPALKKQQVKYETVLYASTTMMSSGTVRWQ